MKKQLPPSDYKQMQLREYQLFLLDKMKVIHSFCNEYSIKYYIIAGSLLGAIRHKGFIPWDDDIDIAMMREDYEKFLEYAPQYLDSNTFFIQNAETDSDFWYPLTRICIKNTFLDFPCEAHLKSCKNAYIDVFPLDNVPEEGRLQIEQERRVKRLIGLAHKKCYSVLPQNPPIQIFLKKCIAVALSVFPLRSIESKIQKEMSRYRSSNTTSVCSMASHYSYKKQTMSKEYYGIPVLYQFENTELYGPAKAHEYLLHLYGADYMKVPEINNRRASTDVYIKQF